MEAYGLLPRNTRIVQVLDDNLIFDKEAEGAQDGLQFRDTGVVFQEKPLCLDAYQLKMVMAQQKSYGKFNDTEFFEEFGEAVRMGQFKR